LSRGEVRRTACHCAPSLCRKSVATLPIRAGCAVSFGPRLVVSRRQGHRRFLAAGHSAPRGGSHRLRVWAAPCCSGRTLSFVRDPRGPGPALACSLPFVSASPVRASPAVRPSRCGAWWCMRLAGGKAVRERRAPETHPHSSVTSLNRRRVRWMRLGRRRVAPAPGALATDRLRPPLPSASAVSPEPKQGCGAPS